MSPIYSDLRNSCCYSFYLPIHSHLPLHFRYSKMYNKRMDRAIKTSETKRMEKKQEKKKLLACVIAAICLGACVRVCRETSISFRSHTFLCGWTETNYFSMLFPFIPSLTRIQSESVLLLTHTWNTHLTVSGCRSRSTTLIPNASSLVYSFVSSCTLFTILFYNI